MRISSILFFSTFLFFILNSCQSSDSNSTQKPSHVTIFKKDNQYQLLVNDKPYQVKGTGISYNEGKNFKAFAEAGGNTFRTWNTENLKSELDSAQKYNLMIAVGLELGKELHDFDYSDSVAVKHQFEEVKKVVDTYKNHPNILCWVAGNEMNLLFAEGGGLKLVQPSTYQALAKIVDYIHSVDPHHPVTTTFAGANKTHIGLALKHCPNLDFLGIQVYGDLIAIQAIVKKENIQMPFMVTEFGPRGHWEMPSTEWGREIEEPSAPKAKGMMERIQKGIVADDSGLIIGSFSFLWGQKQERTPTWYGMFNKAGESTARIDEMTKYWSGSYPENRAPLTDSMKLDEKNAVENIYLKPNNTYTAQVFVREPNGDPIDYKWVMLKEVQDKSQGGALELEPQKVDFKILKDENGVLEFETPKETGDYRIFSYAYDGKGKVGNANIPFFVK